MRPAVLASAFLVLGLVTAPAYAADAVYYYSSDTLHSEVVVTDASRNVVERTYYAPYGQVLNRDLRDGPGYTGHEEDPATGLVYMQQRYYDPEAGRFLSTDPVAADPNSGGNFNRYWYANDNPYRYTDPTGMSADCSTNSKSGTTTCIISHTGTHIQQRVTLKAKQVRNIVFNETRSLSGGKIKEARSEIAHMVINRFTSQADSASGKITVGTYPDTASDVLPSRISAGEQKTLQNIGQIVTNAIADRALGDDPTRGTNSYNFRDLTRWHLTGYRGLSTQKRYGLTPVPSLIQGPFDNSAPSKDLGPTDIYLVPYAAPEQ